MVKWHILVLFLIFHYKLFLAVVRTSAPSGTAVPSESDGKWPNGVSVSDTGVKMSIVTPEALDKPFNEASARLKNVVDPSTKDSVEAWTRLVHLIWLLALSRNWRPLSHSLVKAMHPEEFGH